MYCTINCNSYGTHLFESFSDVSASISAISEEEGNVNAVAVRHQRHVRLVKVNVKVIEQIADELYHLVPVWLVDAAAAVEDEEQVSDDAALCSRDDVRTILGESHFSRLFVFILSTRI